MCVECSTLNKLAHKSPSRWELSEWMQTHIHTQLTRYIHTHNWWEDIYEHCARQRTAQQQQPVKQTKVKQRNEERRTEPAKQRKFRVFWSFFFFFSLYVFVVFFFCFSLLISLGKSISGWTWIYRQTHELTQVKYGPLSVILEIRWMLKYFFVVVVWDF